MPADQDPQIDRRKIRFGLGLISLVVIAAVILMFLVEAPAGKALMFAIAVTAFVRVYLLSKSLRRDGKV